MSNGEWGSPEHEEYLDKFRSVEESDEFRIVQMQLRMIQDNNKLDCVYLVCFDVERENTIYLVDALYGEDNCRPGSFDEGMYEVDKAAMKNPAEGIAPDVTNTEEYGWIVAAGSPIFADGELVCFAGAEISMNQVMEERNRFLLAVIGSLLVLAIIFIAISLTLIDRTIIRPINKLSDTSKRYWSEESTTIRNEFSKLQINTGG